MLKKLAVMAAALALAGCGDDEPDREATPTPAAVGAPGNGFPAKPQVDERFEDGTVSGREPAGRAAEPGTQPAYVVATLRDPTRLQGRAGVFCRGDGDSGYELTVDRRGRARVDRVAGGERTLIAGYDADIDSASDPAEPLPLILACGGGTPDGEVTLGFVVGVQQMTFVRDDEPFDPGATGAAGRIATRSADFAAFQLYLAS